MAEKRSNSPDNPLEKIRQYINTGKYRLSKHAAKRQDERDVSLPKILYVLTNGWHEEQKSLFDTAFQTWKYAIRGKTIDGIDLRVIVGFAEEMMIITVMRVTK